MISKILRIWLLQDMELNLSSGQREYKLRMQNQQTKTKASKLINNTYHPPKPTLQQKMNTYLVYVFVIIQDISQKGNSYKLL